MANKQNADKPEPIEAPQGQPGRDQPLHETALPSVSPVPPSGEQDPVPPTPGEKRQQAQRDALERGQLEHGDVAAIVAAALVAERRAVLLPTNPTVGLDEGPIGGLAYRGGMVINAEGQIIDDDMARKLGIDDIKAHRQAAEQVQARELARRGR